MFTAKAKDYTERRTKEFYGNKPTSPKVEIDLEDAKKIKQLYDTFLVLLREYNSTAYRYVHACYNEIDFKAVALQEAIAKAEAFPDIANMKGNYPELNPTLAKANSIQDQVNELRKELSEIKNTISELKSVISINKVDTVSLKD